MEKEGKRGRERDTHSRTYTHTHTHIHIHTHARTHTHAYIQVCPNCGAELQHDQQHVFDVRLLLAKHERWEDEGCFGDPPSVHCSHNHTHTAHHILSTAADREKRRRRAEHAYVSACSPDGVGAWGSGDSTNDLLDSMRGKCVLSKDSNKELANKHPHDALSARTLSGRDLQPHLPTTGDMERTPTSDASNASNISNLQNAPDPEKSLSQTQSGQGKGGSERDTSKEGGGETSKDSLAPGKLADTHTHTPTSRVQRYAKCDNPPVLTAHSVAPVSAPLAPHAPPPPSTSPILLANNEALKAQSSNAVQIEVETSADAVLKQKLQQV